LYIYKKLLQKIAEHVRKCMRARAQTHTHTHTQNFFRIGQLSITAVLSM